jgi:hypothetical protein
MDDGYQSQPDRRQQWKGQKQSTHLVYQMLASPLGRLLRGSQAARAACTVQQVQIICPRYLTFPESSQVLFIKNVMPPATSTEPSNRRSACVAPRGQLRMATI